MLKELGYIVCDVLVIGAGVAVGLGTVEAVKRIKANKELNEFYDKYSTQE